MKIEFKEGDAAMLKKYAHAEICFKLCADYIDVYIQENVQWESAKSRALITAAIIEYAKPFKKSYAVDKIEESIVPPEYDHVHKMLIKSRDKYVAHMDSRGLDIPDREFHRVQVIKKGSTIYIDIESPRVKPNTLEHIKTLARKLQEKSKYYRQKYLNKYSKRMFKCEGDVSWELKVEKGFNGLVPIATNQLTSTEWE